jgi:uncharacterized membrane protein
LIASCIDPIEPEPSPYRGRPSFVIDPGGGPNDLGTLGGIRGQAQGVNSSGSIVGYSAFDSTGTVVPMIWTQASGMQRLFGPTDVTEGYAFDINDSGVVAGELLGVGGFRWESDSLYMLANISGFANSTVAAINNSGVIAGAAFDTINSTGLRPMMWDASGNPTALFPTTHSPGEAKDINNNGIVVGWISDPTLGGIV